MNAPGSAPTPSPEHLAGDLRTAVANLVRATRATDHLAPIPAAVLDLLDRHGAMTTAQLAASRGVRHQTMAATVKELTDAGYLDARPDPADARKKVLALTADGTRAIETDRRRRVGLLASAIDQGLNEQERRTLAHALSLIDRISRTVASTEPTPSPEREPITGAW